jgi:hypothetical protein
VNLGNKSLRYSEEKCLDRVNPDTRHAHVLIPEELWTETDFLHISSPPAFKILLFRVVFMKNKF